VVVQVSMMLGEFPIPPDCAAPHTCGFRTIVNTQIG
jgi:hypothetical protein